MKYIYYSIVIAATVLLAASCGHAAGYMIQETNSLFAQAFAGRAAVIDDGSTMFVNPAVLGYQCEHQLIVNNAFVIPHAKLSPSLATQTTGTALANITTPMSGNNGGNGAKFAYVPAFYAIANTHSNVKFGIGITSPWGLQTAYEGSSVLRYISTKTKLMTVNINPAVAFRCANFAIGLGISFERAEANLEKKVDIDMSTVPGGTRSDAFSKVRGTNNAVGANIGAIFEPCEGTRLGLAYRSPIRHKIKGFVSFTNLPSFGAAAASAFPALFRDGPVQATLKTPDVINLSGVQDINDCWSLLGDVMFTRWTVLRQLVITRRDSSSSPPLLVDPQSWHNTVMVSLGFNYKPVDCMVLRAGTAFDQTPTKNKHRNARVPDQDRFWLTGGADYNWNDEVVFKLAYAHLFMRNAKINNTIPLTRVPVAGFPIGAPFLPGSQVAGKFKSHIDIIGFQVLVKL